MACKAKYRMVKNKDGKPDGPSTTDAPAVGKQGQSSEAQVVEGSMEAGRGVQGQYETSSANSSSRNGSRTTGMDIDDHDKENSGTLSTVAASSKAGEPGQDFGGDAKE